MPESEISEADSGSSALALMSENDFDILFVDIGLNDMEGTTLAAAARKLLPAAQIVFATAYSQYGVRAFELGVNNYLLKPFDPARVHTVLEKCRRELEGEAAKAADTRQGREQLHTSRRLPVNINRTIVLLDIDQIVYCLLYTSCSARIYSFDFCNYGVELCANVAIEIHKEGCCPFAFKQDRCNFSEHFL